MFSKPFYKFYNNERPTIERSISAETVGISNDVNDADISLDRNKQMKEYFRQREEATKAQDDEYSNLNPGRVYDPEKFKEESDRAAEAINKELDEYFGEDSTLDRIEQVSEYLKQKEEVEKIKDKMNNPEPIDGVVNDEDLINDYSSTSGVIDDPEENEDLIQNKSHSKKR